MHSMLCVRACKCVFEREGERNECLIVSGQISDISGAARGDISLIRGSEMWEMDEEGAADRLTDGLTDTCDRKKKTKKWDKREDDELGKHEKNERIIKKRYGIIND